MENKKWNAAEKIQEQFYQFLEENNCLEQFIRNLTSYQKKQEKLGLGFDSVQEYLVETPMINWVLSAFPYDMIKEEEPLWSKVSFRFQKDFLCM